MIKVEAVVVRDRVETVMDAVEDQTGHVGVTVIEAVGHGRQRGITHEYRGRDLRVAVPAEGVPLLRREGRARRRQSSRRSSDAARTGHESGDGIVWTTPVFDVTHNRTGEKLEEVEVA